MGRSLPLGHIVQEVLLVQSSASYPTAAFLTFEKFKSICESSGGAVEFGSAAESLPGATS
jgi:hypothetical protein